MERVAFIIERTGQRIDCLLNPEKVSIRRQSGIKRRSLLGRPIGGAAWTDDLLITGSGGLTELQLDLLFDSSLLPSSDATATARGATFWELPEQAASDGGVEPRHARRIEALSNPTSDAKQLTAPFWELAEPLVDARGLGEPRLARFVWGKAWNLLGVVAALSGRFECFLPDGSPQRCWMRLCFVQVREPGIGTDGIAPDTAPTVQGGSFPIESVTSQIAYDAKRPEDGADSDAPPTRMDLIAQELAGSASNWRAIASASGIDDPNAVTAGTLFRVPRSGDRP